MWKTKLDSSQTIFSLVSGRLPSAVAVLRLSGRHAFPAIQKLAGPISKKRQVLLSRLTDLKGEFLDRAILLSFVGPNSFTGEDIIEIQCLGSISIVRRIEDCLLELGLRPAERGEFTYRAYLNQKISLSEIEEMGDLFLARDPSQALEIYRRKDQALESQIHDFRNRLIGVQAILDTAVDFSDEYSEVVRQAREPIQLVIHGCSVITQRYARLKNQEMFPKVVLAGRTNAGKSSLFNALLCRYRAVVDEQPGTTTDVVEENIQLLGKTWSLVDTAGVRSAERRVEKEGIQLGNQYILMAKVWILIVDGTIGMQKDDWDCLERYKSIPHFILWNKSDKSSWAPPALDKNLGEKVFEVSAIEGSGLDIIWNALESEASQQIEAEAGPTPTGSQYAKLEFINQELNDLLVALSQGEPPEYLSERNRSIIGRLDSVIGTVDEEMILDRVFSEFCIGK